MAHLIDRHCFKRACEQLHQKTGWEFIAINENEGATPEDDRFYQIIEMLFYYLSDEFKFINKGTHDVEKTAPMDQKRKSIV